MRGQRAVYRAVNGAVYIEQADGTFFVVRLDGGLEVRYDLPASAYRLVSEAEDAA